MARYCKVYPEDFERNIWINKKLVRFQGVAFFETKTELKNAACKLREQFRVSARAITIPESYTDGGVFGGYFERYLLMAPTDNRKDFVALQEAAETYEGYTRG